MKQLKIAKIGYISISIIFYIAGILCLILPTTHTVKVALAAGIILILYGAVKIIGYFSRDLYCLAFQYDFACGMLLIVLGIIILCLHEKFNEYMLAGSGILILLDSLLGIQTTLDAQKFGLTTWGVILASSVVTGALAVLLIITNSKIAAGCALLSEGFMRQYVVQCTVRLTPRLQYHNEKSF